MARSASDRILHHLQSIYPASVSSIELIELYGPAAKSRVGDLKRSGWRVSVTHSDACAHYALASLTRGQPLHPMAGVDLRQLHDGTWVALPIRGSASHSPEALAEAAQRALEVFREALSGSGPLQPPAPPAPPAPPDMDWIDMIQGLCMDPR